MNYIQLFISIIVSLTFAFQSCTQKPVELLSPETVEKIEAETADFEEIDFKFRYNPATDELWTDLMIDNEGEWSHDKNGRIYESITPWIQVMWLPISNVFELRLKYEIVEFTGVELLSDEPCGEIEKEMVYYNGEFYIIHLEVNDDFVNCLDGTNDEIKLTVRLKL